MHIMWSGMKCIGTEPNGSLVNGDGDEPSRSIKASNFLTNCKLLKEEPVL